MKAMIQDRYGDGDVLRLADHEDPRPGDDDVIVRVRAAGVDRGAWHLMTGLPLIGRPAMGWRRPRNPVRGMEVAGVVERTGRNVTGFAPGDEVFGCGSGTFAELTRARAAHLTRKPANVTFEQAAACPVSAVTALQGLRDGGRIQAGQRVLILGAGGGVGTFAVQLARHFGAEVTGVSRPAKTELVRSLGAGVTVTGRYDLILDTAGLRPLRELRELLTPAGAVVLIGGEGGAGRFLSGLDRSMRALVASPFVKQRLVAFLSLTRRADLDTVAARLADESVRPVIDRVFPLAEAGAAMHHLASGEVRGKVVVTVD